MGAEGAAYYAQKHFRIQGRDVAPGDLLDLSGVRNVASLLSMRMIRPAAPAVVDDELREGASIHSTALEAVVSEQGERIAALEAEVAELKAAKPKRGRPRKKPVEETNE